MSTNISSYSSPPPSYSSLYGSAGNASTAATSAAPEDIQLSSGYQPVSQTAETTDPTAASSQPPKKGFFSGMWDGAKNAVKSLFTPKGLLLAGAGLAACIAFPVAAPLVLGGLAVGAGGYQMYKGAKNHDSYQMGGGALTAGLGGLGLWGSGAVGALRSGSSDSAAASTGGFMDKVKSLNPFKSKPPATPPAPTATETPTAAPSSRGWFGRSSTPAATTDATTGTGTVATNATKGTPAPTTGGPVDNRTFYQRNVPTFFGGKAAPVAPEAEAAATDAATAAKTPWYTNARTNLSNFGTPVADAWKSGGESASFLSKSGDSAMAVARGLKKPAWSLPSTSAISGYGGMQEQQA